MSSKPGQKSMKASRLWKRIKQHQTATDSYKFHSTALSWSRNDQKRVRNRLWWLCKAWTPKRPGFQNPSQTIPIPSETKERRSNKVKRSTKFDQRSTNCETEPRRPRALWLRRLRQRCFRLLLEKEWDSDLTTSRPHMSIPRRESYGYR